MPKMTCPKCGAKNAEGETFCAKCGVRIVAQAAPVGAVAVKAAPVAQPMAIPTAPGRSGDKRKLYLVIVAAVVIAAVLATYFMTRNAWKPPDIPISQAISQGYPVICEVRGPIDGIPRNYDIYIKSPKYAAYAVDANEAFLLYNGVKYYTRSLLKLSMPPAGCTSEACRAEHFRRMYDPSAQFEDCSALSSARVDLNEFIEDYRKMKGSAGERANVTCRIVQSIDDSKFELPPGKIPTTCELEALENVDYCSAMMPVGKSVEDPESGMTITNFGKVEQGDKTVCKFGVTGGDADDCGGLSVFFDVEGAIAAGAIDDPTNFVTCQMAKKILKCFELCSQVVQSI